MQEEFEKKTTEKLILYVSPNEGLPPEGEHIINIDCRVQGEFEYPSSFLSLVRAWRKLLAGGESKPADYEFSGSGIGACIVLAACLWCRDHGLPLPGSIALDHPVLHPQDGLYKDFFSAADVDDSCAFPLIADYYGFPCIVVITGEKDPLMGQAESLCDRLEAQDIPFEKRIINN